MAPRGSEVGGGEAEPRVPSQESRAAALEARQVAILHRIERLELVLGPAPCASAADAAAQAQGEAEAEGGGSGLALQLRLEQELRSRGIEDFLFARVPKDYYSWELERRRDVLSAPSTDHLCKTICLKNTQALPQVVDCSNPNNSLYYLVVVQYNAKLNTEKVRSFVHSLSEGVPKKRYNMRLAPEEEARELTGFVHNAVTPVGVRTRVPIILSHLIAGLQPGFFWMGGGEVDLKLRVGVEDFVDKYKPFVVDCT